jgi:hypothetical protein
MGALYMVAHEATRRQRALKLMHPELTTHADLPGKLVQQARIGGRSESDHVVDIVDAGVDAATGTPWLAIERLEGEDRPSLLARRGQLARGEVATIFEPLGHAVGAAPALDRRNGCGDECVHTPLMAERDGVLATRRSNNARDAHAPDLGLRCAP